MTPCSNTQHTAPATVEVMARWYCASCARSLRLGVPSVPRRIEDELFEHVRAAFPRSSSVSDEDASQR